MFTTSRSILRGPAVTDGLSVSNLHVLIVKTDHRRGRSTPPSETSPTSRCIADARTSPTRHGRLQALTDGRGDGERTPVVLFLSSCVRSSSRAPLQRGGPGHSCPRKDKMSPQSAPCQIRWPSSSIAIVFKDKGVGVGVGGVGASVFSQISLRTRNMKTSKTSKHLTTTSSMITSQSTFQMQSWPFY